jgi:hypothetical protein
MAGGTGKIVHQMRVAGTTLPDWKTLTGHATDQTIKGTAVDLVASLPDAVQFIKLAVAGSAVVGTDTSMLMDILVDDVVKIPNMQVGFTYAHGITNRPHPRWGLPISIPSGSKVSAQVATLVDADTVQVYADFYGSMAGPLPANSIDTLGADTATVRGVTLLSGLANGKGLWTEIEDSTPNTYRGLAVSIGGDVSMTNQHFLLDIGVGSGSPPENEVALVSDILFTTDGGTESIGNFADLGVFPLENELAVGSRIAARIQSQGAAVNDIQVIVHGIK